MQVGGIQRVVKSRQTGSGYIAAGADYVDITITAVDVNKSVIEFGSQGVRGFAFNSSTSFRANRFYGASNSQGGNFDWQVIEYA